MQLVTLVVTATLQLVNSQVPPRLNIPGAVPLPVTYRPQHRNEKLVRVRRPQALRASNAIQPQFQQQQRLLEEAKPVTESNEDNHPDIFLPQLLREQQLAQTQQSQFQQQAASFFQGEPNTVQDSFISNGGQQLLEELEPQTASPFPLPQPTRPAARPAFNDYGIGRFASGERPSISEQNSPSSTPVRPTVQRNRPQLRAQYDAPQAPQPTQRLRPKPIQSRPIIDQNQLQDERDQQQQLYNRRQQPVAQTVRKWREESEDGSITWGYENDDGSFKEELIGIDCVTKGTYGYIDPDGNKREYHYETGNKCNPNTRETEEEELDNNGSINYDENTAVLPNGVEINMSQLGKKKSRRPGANFAF